MSVAPLPSHEFGAFTVLELLRGGSQSQQKRQVGGNSDGAKIVSILHMYMHVGSALPGCLDAGPGRAETAEAESYTFVRECAPVRVFSEHILGPEAPTRISRRKFLR